jgi:hypothetical protein
MPTLEQFLQTGELGPLHPGMREAEVIALLGPAPDESVARHPSILKYGGLQIILLRNSKLGDCRLSRIALYFRPPLEPIPAPALPSDFKPTSDTTLDDIRDFLARVGLKESAIVENDDSASLIMPSGARIAFEENKLHSMSFAAPASGPPKKQISVSITAETLNKLKTLAKQSNKSVSELCAEWISQRAHELQHVHAGINGPS